MAFGISRFVRALVCPLLRMGLIAAGLSASLAVQAAPHQSHLTLIVPATVGGGWDITAKAMKVALEKQHLVDHVEIIRYPGAGGLVGLSEFVARYRGHDDALLVGGLVMLGSSLRDEAAVTLRDVIPVARLTGEWSMVVAPVNSPIQTIDDMRNAMLARSDSVRWAGGAFAGPDQGLVWQIAQQLGVPLDEVAYYGRPGGRRVAETLTTKRADLGVSGYAEFAPFVAKGQLRVLATASPERVAGVNAPTLREAGIDVTMMNWRAVFAPPGIDGAAQDRLSDLVRALVNSPAWREQLATNRWTNTYLDRDAFSQFIDREQIRWTNLVNPLQRASDTSLKPHLPTDWRWLKILAGVLVALAAISLGLLWQLRLRRAAAAELERRCGILTIELQERAAAAGKLVRDGIDVDFGDWKLSSAECDIAWFMLRGLPLREIAVLRGTSERTVRQQAQAIYRKAGLEGRSDLAGRVLERFI